MRPVRPQVGPPHAHRSDRREAFRCPSAHVLLRDPRVEGAAALVEGVVAAAEAAERLTTRRAKRVRHRHDAGGRGHPRRHANRTSARPGADRHDQPPAGRIRRGDGEANSPAIPHRRDDRARGVLHPALTHLCEVPGPRAAELLLDVVLAHKERERRVEGRGGLRVAVEQHLRGVGDGERARTGGGDMTKDGAAPSILDREPERRARDHRTRAGRFDDDRVRADSGGPSGGRRHRHDHAESNRARRRGA